MTAVRRRTVASDMRAFEKFQQREARRTERERRVWRIHTHPWLGEQGWAPQQLDCIVAAPSRAAAARALGISDWQLATYGSVTGNEEQIVTALTRPGVVFARSGSGEYVPIINGELRRPTMKVRVTVEMEIDRDAYDAEYGSHESADDIRAHVKGVVATAAESAFSYIDAVTVKGHH